LLISPVPVPPCIPAVPYPPPPGLGQIDWGLLQPPGNVHGVGIPKPLVDAGLITTLDAGSTWMSVA
jgi:hypothetical protein